MADDQKDPRVFLAAERTLLAWIRTGLALMGAIVNVAAAINHQHLITKLRRRI